MAFYYLRARYLHVESGRLVGMDLFEGDLFEPPSLHKYMYAQDDPMNKIDPSGEYTLMQAAATGAVTSILALNTWQRLDPNPTITKAAVVATGAFFGGAVVYSAITSALEVYAVGQAATKVGIYTSPVLLRAVNPNHAESLLGRVLAVADQGQGVIQVLVNRLNIQVPGTLRFRRPYFFAVGRYIADSKFYTVSQLVLSQQMKDFVAIAKYYNTPLY